LFWNGAAELPYDAGELINYTDDLHRLVENPMLPGQAGIELPRWIAEENQFADGSLSIRRAFQKLVIQYGMPHALSPVLDAANATNSPSEDILGNPRPYGGAPDIGAIELLVADELPGDLNRDGAVNEADVQLCVAVILGMENDPAIIARSDINLDRETDVLDLQLIVNVYLGN